ncbi:MAG: insulinase family protein [Caldilineales bacterium]|nr:insulinase family protein [Caldilineales bacterium]
MTGNGVARSRLDNGLLVLLREVHHAPVASFWIWYRVGSRNERPGLTGISHWVEHMLFKGTPAYPEGEFDRMVQREGGYLNGMTWIDWTTYYETMPAERIDVALGIEADRMTNSLFMAEETERERTVIISEREGNENRPTYRLYEQVQALSFQAHPYRHMVIGRKEDLRRITRDELMAHYREFYTPNNAVIVVTGDFDTPTLLGQIERSFGGLAAGVTPPPVPVQEPDPAGERRIRMDGPGGAAHLAMSFRVPPASHPDFFPLVVLDAVLGGAKGMPPFGGSGLGRSARLYRALVNTGLATSSSSSMGATIDPYLFTISATASPAATPEQVETAILSELRRVREQAVGSEELGRAIKGARAQFVYASESVSNQALWLGFSEMVADADWLHGFLDNLAAVSIDDVQRVAQRYLTDENRVVGWYLPDGGTA